ncbi:unnamed protein product [Lathyrus oleraceus]
MRLQSHHFITISLFFLIISNFTQKELVTEGRKTLNHNDSHQTLGDKKVMVRAQIGSRPPRCETRCRFCGHCEAIQVPTNPRTLNGNNINPSTMSTNSYARRQDNSNYKPMSWKCKCGNIIFNP